jgi:ABC-type antimicrobial peptide transport system permease subunit
MRNSSSLILLILLISVVFIAGCASQQKIVGHPYEVRGQYYDYDPSVPLIGSIYIDLLSAPTIENYYDYQDLYNQYSYQCFSLKNEGTAAFTTAQSAAAGTSSQEQMLNYYSMAKDAIQREENCQASIQVFQQHSLMIVSEVNNYNQILNELSQNMQISKNDENTEITNYNNIASDFNNAIISCSNSNQVVGSDGMCHDICVAPNIYCQ